MPLEEEQATYSRELKRLLPSAGKFVLIHGAEVGGVYDTYSDALKIGYEKYGLTPFLVRQIEATQSVQTFTRDVGICRLQAAFHG